MLTFYTHHVLSVIHILHNCVSRGPMRAAVWRALFSAGFVASVDSQTSWVRRRPPAHRRRFGSRMSFTHQHWAGRTSEDRSVFLTLGEPLLYVRPSAGFTEWSTTESDGGINAADGRHSSARLTESESSALKADSWRHHGRVTSPTVWLAFTSRLLIDFWSRSSGFWQLSHNITRRRHSML